MNDSQSVLKAYIESLLSEKRQESRELDYKREFSSKNKTVDFLEDVCALANTTGGELIVGIEAVDGIPVKVSPLTINADAEILGLQNSIRDRVEPRLVGVDISAVKFNGGYVLLVRVKKSWNALHHIKDGGRFVGRNSRGNYPLDVSEIRNSFAMSEAIPARIKQFRAERILRTRSSDSGVVLKTGQTVVMHIVPIEAFTTKASIDLLDVTHNRALPVLGRDSNERYRLNLDGVLSHQALGADGCTAYTQLFRSGIVEAVMVTNPYGQDKVISGGALESVLTKGFILYLQLLQRRGVRPPIYLFAAFLDWKDYCLGWNQGGFNEHSEPLDRDMADFPEVVLLDYPTQVSTAIEPLFIDIWHAFGQERPNTGFAGS